MELQSCAGYAFPVTLVTGEISYFIVDKVVVGFQILDMFATDGALMF